MGQYYGNSKNETFTGDVTDKSPIIETNSLHEHRMNVWHSMCTELSQSREIMDKKKDEIVLRLRARQELLKGQISASLDVAQKIELTKYVEKISKIEKEFLHKIDQLEIDNSNYECNARQEIYNFFDKAKEDIKKWQKDKPERYQEELDRLNTQQHNRLKSVSERLTQLELKRKDIFDKATRLFDADLEFDSFKRKFIS